MGEHDCLRGKSGTAVDDFEQKVWRNDSTCFDAFASSEFWMISLNIPLLNGYWFKTLRIIAMRLLESMAQRQETLIDAGRSARKMVKASTPTNHNPDSRSIQARKLD